MISEKRPRDFINTQTAHEQIQLVAIDRDSQRGAQGSLLGHDNISMGQMQDVHPSFDYALILKTVSCESFQTERQLKSPKIHDSIAKT